MPQSFNLQPYNTFGFNAQATHGRLIYSDAELINAIKSAQIQNLPLIILGGGSNIVIKNNLNAMVLIIKIPGIKLIKENNEHVYIKIGAGVEWDYVVQYTLQNNWYGLENLSLIPGTVGACPIQNVGAYGVEIKDFFHELEALELANLQSHIFSYDDCKFTYRDSIFKNKYKDQFAITSVTLKLHKTPKINTNYTSLQQALERSEITTPSPLQIRKTVIGIRTLRLPNVTTIGNAGSFFTNPIIDKKNYQNLIQQHIDLTANPCDNNHYKISAGWLIAKCGFQGYREHDVGVYQHNPLVLVNHGNGTSAQLLNLVEKITTSVKEKFAIQLCMEPRLYS